MPELGIRDKFSDHNAEALIGKKCKLKSRYSEMPLSKIGVGGEENVDRIQYYIEQGNEYRDGFLRNGYDYEKSLNVYKGRYISQETKLRLTKNQPYPFTQKWWEYIEDNYIFENNCFRMRRAG